MEDLKIFGESDIELEPKGKGVYAWMANQTMASVQAVTVIVFRSRLLCYGFLNTRKVFVVMLHCITCVIC